MKTEACVTIDGRVLTDDQVATIRIALVNIHQEMVTSLTRRQSEDTRAVRAALNRTAIVLNMLEETKVG